MSDCSRMLAVAWPLVAARLDRSLSSRGVGRLDREDIVQEVAARALASRVPFSSADDLVGWALTVGHNLWTDDGRRWRRMNGALLPLAGDDDEGGVELPPADVDVAARVEKQLEVEAVLRALAAMSDDDQEAIVSDMVGRRFVGRRQTNLWGQRRHRVRKRLRAVLDGAAGGFAALRLRLRLEVPALTQPVAGLGLAVLPAAVALFAPSPPVATGERARAVPTAVARPFAQRGQEAPRPTPSPAPATARRAHASSPQPGTPRPPAVDLRSPAGEPVVAADVRDEDGDDASLCVANVPVVGSRCLLDGPVVAPLP